MTKREAAEKLCEVLKAYPPARKPAGFPRVLTPEAIELSLERKHYLMGEESLRLHPWWPAALATGWGRLRTGREKAWIEAKDARRQEMADRQASLDNPRESKAERLRREIAERQAALEALEQEPNK